ncbi:MAG: nucleotide exchange factor GrpE [Acidobacteria bacterium]|nr:MAG: nucleotide exchange factor GrpE [Acidobacteriota bacterium]
MKNEKDLTEEFESQAGSKVNSSAKPDSDGAALPADLPAAYRQLLAEKKELFDRLVRKQAELENVRKRVEREKEDFLQHATMGLIRALLPTLDALERGLKHREENVPDKFYSGMELIHRELLEVLKRAGLAPVESEGRTFDPHVHQAVESIETDEFNDQAVVEELQRGYKLKERLLRPAIVRVAVTPGAKTASPKEDEPPDVTSR